MYAALSSDPQLLTRVAYPDQVIDRKALFVMGTHELDDKRSVSCYLSDDGLKINLSEHPDKKKVGIQTVDVTTVLVSWEEIYGMAADSRMQKIKTALINLIEQRCPDWTSEQRKEWIEDNEKHLCDSVVEAADAILPSQGEPHAED